MHPSPWMRAAIWSPSSVRPSRRTRAGETKSSPWPAERFSLVPLDRHMVVRFRLSGSKPQWTASPSMAKSRSALKASGTGVRSSAQYSRRSPVLAFPSDLLRSFGGTPRGIPEMASRAIRLRKRPRCGARRCAAHANRRPTWPLRRQRAHPDRVSSLTQDRRASAVDLAVFSAEEPRIVGGAQLTCRRR